MTCLTTCQQIFTSISSSKRHFIHSHPRIFSPSSFALCFPSRHRARELGEKENGRNTFSRQLYSLIVDQSQFKLLEQGL